jgi:hypothetical protein
VWKYCQETGERSDALPADTVLRTERGCRRGFDKLSVVIGPFFLLSRPLALMHSQMSQCCKPRCTYSLEKREQGRHSRASWGIVPDTYRPANFHWHWSHRRKILQKTAEKSRPLREHSQMSQCCKPRCIGFRAKIPGPSSDSPAETLFGELSRRVQGANRTQSGRTRADFSDLRS